jgi:hypothetical protein
VRLNVPPATVHPSPRTCSSGGDLGSIWGTDGQDSHQGSTANGGTSAADGSFGLSHAFPSIPDNG